MCTLSFKNKGCISTRKSSTCSLREDNCGPINVALGMCCIVSMQSSSLPRRILVLILLPILKWLNTITLVSSRFIVKLLSAQNDLKVFRCPFRETLRFDTVSDIYAIITRDNDWTPWMLEE